MIKVKDLTFSYDKILFDKINLEINPHKVTLIIGYNGCGKSTLSYLLSGLLFPKSGTITIDDLPITKKTNNLLIRKKIGIVFQNPHNQILFTDVYEDIKFTLENIKTPPTSIDNIIKSSLTKVNLIDYIHSNPYNLSGGQKQRLAIASQISLKPHYLIFDEATSMLDNTNKEDIYTLITKLKKEMGIIFITNNINELLLADEVIIFDNKKPYKYSINEIIADPSILTKHHQPIPFILKIASLLHLTNKKDINEENITKLLATHRRTRHD